MDMENIDYFVWLEEKLIYALCPKRATELSDTTKLNFKHIIRYNYENRNKDNYGDTRAIKRDLKNWYDGKVDISMFHLK